MTPRQKKVHRLTESGMSAEKIAAKLGIAPKSVRRYQRRACHELRCSDSLMPPNPGAQFHDDERPLIAPRDWPADYSAHNLDLR